MSALLGIGSALEKGRKKLAARDNGFAAVDEFCA